MSRKIFTVIVIALLMAGTAWAGDTTVFSSVGNASSVNTAWSGVNGTLTFNGQLGNALGNSTNVNVYNGANGAFSGNANLANTGFYANEVPPAGSGNYVASTINVLNANFAGGGYADFDVTRNLSYTPSYGPGGQTVVGLVSSDNTGSFTMNSANTSYGGFSVGNTIQNATGNFGIQYGLTDVTSGGANGAHISNFGNGSSQLYAHMSTATNSKSGSNPLVFDFGRGGGCYTGATITASGIGTVTEWAGASNQLGIYVGKAEPYPVAPQFVIPGDGTPGSASFNLMIFYAGNFTLPNFSLGGN